MPIVALFSSRWSEISEMGAAQGSIGERRSFYCLLVSRSRVTS